MQALLARYGRADSVVFGTPLANRSRPELEGLIGYFVNTVAIHVDLSGDCATLKACASSEFAVPKGHMPWLHTCRGSFAPFTRCYAWTELLSPYA